MEIKLNRNKIGIKNDSQLLLVYCAFMFVCKEMEGKTDIGELKPAIEGEEVCGEIGFREFLQTIAAMQYDVHSFTEHEMSVLNQILEYLSVPYTEQPEKPQKRSAESKSMAQMIEEAKNKAKKL